VTLQPGHGVGVVTINGAGAWALWVCDPAGGWKIRLSIDDFEALGVHEYQRVRVRLPGRNEADVYFKRRRVNPPFVWLEFGADVRR